MAAEARRRRADTLRIVIGVGGLAIAEAEERIADERAELEKAIREAHTDQLLTVAEMSRLSGFSRQTIHAWLRTE